MFAIRGTIAAFALFALTACGQNQTVRSEDETNLRLVRSGSNEPEEFSIVPNKPLEQPQEIAELPEPTPGQANRADQTPLQDAVAALGGNPDRLQPTALTPATDRAIVLRASRFGINPTIREELAAEDLEFRKRRSIFSWRLLPTDSYFDAYRRETLDPYATLDAARRAGVQTPSAPPE